MSNENRKPLDFDWVTARQQCSLRDVFEALRLGIRDDVETRNSSFPEGDPDKLVLKISERGKTVRVYWDDMYGSSQNIFVELTLTEQNVSAKDNESTLFEAFICLNDDGDCKLKISGKEYDLWQVRRKALEKLLFSFNP